jgi:hypothetical protein
MADVVPTSTRRRDRAQVFKTSRTVETPPNAGLLDTEPTRSRHGAGETFETKTSSSPAGLQRVAECLLLFGGQHPGPQETHDGNDQCRHAVLY